MVFEGEYSYGDRYEGKGKEIDSNGRIFEGIYKGGKKNSQLIEFDESRNNGTIYNDYRYKIEYNFGKIWKGNVTEYHNGILIFEGEYKDGMKWNGKVKKFHDVNGVLIFDGEIQNGMNHGHAIEYDYMNNLTFEGEYKNGIRWNGNYKDFNEYNNNLSSEGYYINGEKKITRKCDWSGMTIYS